MEKISTNYVNLQAERVKTDFANGVMAIYTGSQPASADAAETGTLLCLITKDGEAFTAGNPTNGLNFGSVSNNVVSKSEGETWSGKVLVDGVAGWFRFYDNNHVTGASTTANRFDGSISYQEMEELQFPNITVLPAGSTLIVENFSVTCSA